MEVRAFFFEDRFGNNSRSPSSLFLLLSLTSLLFLFFRGEGFRFLTHALSLAHSPSLPSSASTQASSWRCFPGKVRPARCVGKRGRERQKTKKKKKACLSLPLSTRNRGGFPISPFPSPVAGKGPPVFDSICAPRVARFRVVPFAPKGVLPAEREERRNWTTANGKKGMKLKKKKTTTSPFLAQLFFARLPQFPLLLFAPPPSPRRPFCPTQPSAYYRSSRSSRHIFCQKKRSRLEERDHHGADEFGEKSEEEKRRRVGGGDDGGDARSRRARGRRLSLLGLCRIRAPGSLPRGRLPGARPGPPPRCTERPVTLRLRRRLRLRLPRPRRQTRRRRRKSPRSPPILSRPPCAWATGTRPPRAAPRPCSTTPTTPRSRSPTGASGSSFRGRPGRA